MDSTSLIHDTLVKAGDLVIGGVGASGGTVEQDQKVATAAVAGFSDGNATGGQKGRSSQSAADRKEFS
jgi:hypothetical protein